MLDFVLNRPHVVAYVAGTVFPLTCLVSYVLALSLNHIRPVITYISDASTDPPVSGVFGMFLTYSMLLFGLVTLIRHRLVKHICEIKPELATSKMRLSNTISGWLALTSVVCLIVVASFQVSTSKITHGFAAFVGIGLGVIYCFMQVICTRPMVPMVTTPGIYCLRLVLAVVAAASFVFGVLTALLSFAKFKGTTLHRWNPEDGGYLEHAISAVCEWILAAVYAAYIMSFAHEFRHTRIKDFRVSWVGSDNGKLNGVREPETA